MVVDHIIFANHLILCPVVLLKTEGKHAPRIPFQRCLTGQIGKSAPQTLRENSVEIGLAQALQCIALSRCE